MSSELERRTAIIVALRCGRAPKEIINFFKFPKVTVYSIAKSFRESEDIEEGFLTPERKTPDQSQGQNVNKEVYLDVMQTVVKPWMTQIAAGRPYLYQQDGAPAHTSNLVQNWCLENLDMFWSKEFWPPSSPDLNPCDYYLWGVLERDTTLWTP
ncbi:Transposable element tcb1 transposase [Caligus rogercresseyi]|uniref:Transposable element tcb1 transposase n=1 Tax=Caligus rogercresseyi TaxID=217165 RepID=A0A7T8H252_CALRO|nr:Transposable element tcb1 transposase [Caligus rogercresseyi]